MRITASPRPFGSRGKVRPDVAIGPAAHGVTGRRGDDRILGTLRSWQARGVAPIDTESREGAAVRATACASLMRQMPEGKETC